jgi:fumarate reductase subunit D
MARSNEPLWWAPFFAGAGVAALLMPVTIILTGIAIPLGWIGEDSLFHLLQNPLVRIYLFVLISLSLFHAVHRIRFILVDLGLKAARNIIAIVCYATAIAGTVFAAILVLPFWS